MKLFHELFSLHYFRLGPGEFAFLTRTSAWKFAGAELYFTLASLCPLLLHLPVRQSSKIYLVVFILYVIDDFLAAFVHSSLLRLSRPLKDNQLL